MSLIAKIQLIETTYMNWDHVLMALQPAIKPSFPVSEGELVVQESDGFMFYLAEGKTIYTHPDAVGEPWQIVGPNDAVSIRRPSTRCKSYIEAQSQHNGLWQIKLVTSLDDGGHPIRDGLWMEFHRVVDELPSMEVPVDTSRPARPRGPRRRDLARR